MALFGETVHEWPTSAHDAVDVEECANCPHPYLNHGPTGKCCTTVVTDHGSGNTYSEGCKCPGWADPPDR